MRHSTTGPARGYFLLKTEGDLAALRLYLDRLMPPRCDRHVWLYRDNPNGVFAPFNPNVLCKHHRGATSHPGHGHAD